jgi:tRNA pseudouridine55 synthase
MSRRKRGLNIHGVVLLDKPAGITSNRALQKVRGIFQAKKAGHTGSLDPFATGMLPICLGEASKTAAFMLDAGKQYRATALLGEATTTGDIEGEVIQTCPVEGITEDLIKQVLAGFVGDIQQVPPMYSALKHEGKPLYEHARAGIEIERPARPVTIHQLELIEWQSPKFVFEVKCSKGTYIRTLAEDIARALNTCAHLIGLRRTYVEPFEKHAMVTFEQLQESLADGSLSSHLLPIDEGLPDWPRVKINEEQQSKFSHGNPFAYEATGSKPVQVRVYNANSQLLGFAELTEDNQLLPVKVLNI